MQLMLSNVKSMACKWTYAFERIVWINEVFQPMIAVGSDWHVGYQSHAFSRPSRHEFFDESCPA